MASVISDIELSPAAAPRKAAGLRLPSRMRVLYITTPRRTGGWLAEAFAADSAAKVILEEAVGMRAGLTRLRDEVFDALLVSHEPEELNALDLVEGYRAGGAAEPIVILGVQSEQEMAALAYEVGADGYLCIHTATTRNLLWVIARAVHRHRLERENQRLAQAEQNRFLREQEETAALLRQQKLLLGEAFSSLEPQQPLPPPQFLPAELINLYRELLRTYVIMGVGTLSDDLSRLADLLVSAGLNARETLQLHLHVLQDLIHGLGSRSSRHVMNRADLLALELLLHLAEGYRHRYQQRLNPPVQLRLPGIE